MPVTKRLYWFLIVVSLFRLAVASVLELSPDEGYYWQWGKNLSLSYYDHPPMVAIFIAMTTLFSDAELFVRLSGVLGAALSSLLIYILTVKLFKDEAAGFMAVIVMNLSLIFSAGALVITPDTPLVIFYLASLITFYTAANSDSSSAASYGKWIFAGAVTGLAMLSKYTAVFFFPCAFMYMLIAPEKRVWLIRPHPYIAAFTAFITFTPVLLWNARYDWISFAFQAEHGLAKLKTAWYALFAEFFSFQIVLYSFGIFFFLIAAFFTLFPRSFGFGSGKDARPEVLDGSRFLLSFALPILLFFFFNATRARVEGNWPILGYLPLFVQTGVLAVERYLKDGVRKSVSVSVGIALFLLVFFHLQVVNPVIPHPHRDEISIRLYGWEEIGRRVDANRENGRFTFAVTNRAQVASLVNYYTSPHMETYMPNSNWKRFFFLKPIDSRIGENAIYVTEVRRDDIENIKKMFERVEKAESFDTLRKGELIRKVNIYKCYNYLGGIK